MNLVSVSTPDELVTMLKLILWPDENKFKDIGEPDLSYEEISSILGVSDHELAVHNGVTHDQHSDNWFDVVEDYDGQTLYKWAVEDKQFAPLKNFVPCAIMWRFDDDFDRHGSITIRMFEIVPQTEMTPTLWIERYDKLQQERAEDWENRKQYDARINMLRAAGDL